MTAAAASPPRDDLIEAVATDLLPRASLITRLLLAASADGLTRAEAGLLSALDGGPQRVTAVAQHQVLAQPTVTQLVARLEGRGLVARTKDPDDGRAVLVTRTELGTDHITRFRETYRGALRSHLTHCSDEDVLALARATELLGDVVTTLTDGRAA